MPLPRASLETGLVYAEQRLEGHCSRARFPLAGPLLLRMLYNPNFKASARWAAFPPSISLISSNTEVAVFSVFSFVLRSFHPVAMIPGCLLFLSLTIDCRAQRRAYRAAKLEKISAAMFSCVSFTSMSSNASSRSVRSGSLFFHESYARGVSTKPQLDAQLQLNSPC